MSNDIKISRMTSGETIMGRVVSETETTITFSKPALVFTQVNRDTQQQEVGIAPFAPFAQDEKVPVYKSSLQYAPVVVNKQLIANYIKATTNLDIPSKPGIILES